MSNARYPQYRLTEWLDTSEAAMNKPQATLVYGIQTMREKGGRWMHCANGTQPMHFESLDKASEAIRSLREADGPAVRAAPAAKAEVKPVHFPINVKVNGGGGAYTTQTVAGQRASSTSSAETAVGRLVDKLTAALQLQPGTLTARDLQAKGQRPTCSVWQISQRDLQGEPRG